MTAEANPTLDRAGPTEAVRVAAVQKTFMTDTADVEALANIDLTVNEGEFVSILGPSGCGKSTLLAIIAGLERPTGGDVHVLGDRVAEPVTSLGIVFQDDLLLEWRSVLENVLLQVEVRGWDKRRYRDRALELLSQVGLDGFEDARPQELSGGMRQRVAICRSLIHDPPLLLMDEPFGALDALTRDQMGIDLQHLRLQAKKTVVFVTHSISEAVFLSDRIVVVSPRPGTIRQIIDIDLPQPRNLATQETNAFVDYSRQVRHLFEEMGLLRDAAPHDEPEISSP